MFTCVGVPLRSAFTHGMGLNTEAKSVAPRLPPEHTSDIQLNQAAVLLQCLGKGPAPLSTDVVI